MKILIEIDDSYEPEEGDAFEAVACALNHFYIPSVMTEVKQIEPETVN